MPDEYYERYRRVEHAQLYRELRAGSPRRTDALADHWHTVAESLRATATAARTDLAELQTSWVGEGSREYQYRLGLVAAWAETLADEAEKMRAGLTTMSAELAEAQRKADPEPAESAEWAHDAVLASTLGLVATDAQRGQSHERMAQLVAELAVAYELADSRTWTTPRPPPSPDLPGRFVESDLRPREALGTILAGTVGERVVAVPSAGLNLAGSSANAPAGSGPIGTDRPATMLTGAGSGLAASAAAGKLNTQPGSGGTTSTGPAGAMLPPPVMGAGLAPASTSEPMVTGRPTYDETSWSSGEDLPWADSADEPPPSILGNPARPA